MGSITAAMCIVMAVIDTVYAENKQPSNHDFAVFWQGFRKAVLEKNWQTLERKCNFPLLVKGVLDRDPVHQVGQHEFPKVFEQFLREGVFFPNERLDFIRKTTTVPKDGYKLQHARRVGDMIFRKTARGWLLDTLYMQYTSE